MLANLCPWPLSYQENLNMRNSMCQSQSISRQNGFLENLWKQRWTLVIFLGMENILCPGFSFSWDCLHFLALGEFIYNLYQQQRVILCVYFIIIMIIFSCKCHRVSIFVNVFQSKTDVSKKLQVFPCYNLIKI